MFKDKVVVITGGSEGIGKALVEAFLELGAKVATCGRNYDKLYLLQQYHANQPLVIHTADVSKETDCKSFIERTIKIFGTIDILINNAGISHRGLFMECELNSLKRVMDINFWGAVHATKYALPYIIKNKGTVAAISSIAGYRGLPGRSGYSASKFAINGWMEALRTELMGTGVHVAWYCPGFTASNIRNVALDKNGNPQGESPLEEKKLMPASKVAQHIIRAIKKRKRTIILTANGKETVLMNKLFPALTDKLVKYFFYKDGVLVK